jgi:hypothetical protein
MIRDFDNGMTGVLLMIRAKPAIIRATLVDFGAEAMGHGSGPGKPLDLQIMPKILADQRPAVPMVRAIFFKIDPLTVREDLGVD